MSYATTRSIREKSVNSESDVQQYLIEFLRTAGYMAEDEVRSQDGNHRADIIVKDDQFNLGIEVKKWNGTRSGKKISHVLKQVYEYIGKKFINEKVILWALVPYVDNFQKIETPISIVRDIANGMGIGFINLQQKPHLYTDYQFGDDAAKIYLGEQPNDCILKRKSERYAQTGDIGYIRDLIRDRVPHLGKEEGK